VFGVSYPIVDLIVGVQMVARTPFVSLFQVLTMEEENVGIEAKGLLKCSS